MASAMLYGFLGVFSALGLRIDWLDFEIKTWEKTAPFDRDKRNISAQ